MVLAVRLPLAILVFQALELAVGLALADQVLAVGLGFQAQELADLVGIAALG